MPASNASSQAGAALARAIGPELAQPRGVAVDFSIVDTLQAARICHRQRHVEAASLGGSALPGADGNAASRDGEPPKIDANRAAEPPQETARDVGHVGLAAMEVSVSGGSAEHAWMNIAASMLAHAQTTRGAGRGSYRRDVMMQPVNLSGVQGTPLALVIGSRQ
ncbi:MAG TPA: hypothetical protein VF469_34365 [Kofleriaceae bacterium]